MALNEINQPGRSEQPDPPATDYTALIEELQQQGLNKDEIDEFIRTKEAIAKGNLPSDNPGEPFDGVGIA